MRKYFTHDLGDEPAIGFGEASEVYLASDVDARIAELETALRGLMNDIREGADPLDPVCRLKTLSWDNAEASLKPKL